nr:Chain X, LEDGF peptide [Homo sapiens]3AVA_Y Chain Y, LEDGF peptide [Homo sapiens]
ALKIDNLD